MTAVHKECEGCRYNRPLSTYSVSAGNCCHYLLDTGRRREIGECGNCLSMDKEKEPEA